MECRGKRASLLFGIPKISISEDALFMKHTLLYFFEVVTAKFTDSVKENASKGSRVLKKPPKLEGRPHGQFRLQQQLRLHGPANDPDFHVTNSGHQACSISPHI